MLLKFFILLFQCVIIFNKYYVTKALLGPNIKHPNANEYLFVASIVRTNPYYPAYTEKICIGAFISRKDVITAAHCVQNAQVSTTEIVGGCIDYRYTNRMKILWFYPYNLWVQQMNYQLEFQFNDIAIIRLVQNAPDPVTVLPITQKTNSQLVGKRAIMASWTGTTSNVIPTLLDLGEVKIISNQRCNEMRNRLNLTDRLHTRYLCSIAKPYMVLQPGDSGGPLIYKNTFIGVNVGFAPYNDNHPSEEKINLHVGVEYYRTFIQSILITN